MYAKHLAQNPEMETIINKLSSYNYVNVLFRKVVFIKSQTFK